MIDRRANAWHLQQMVLTMGRTVTSSFSVNKRRTNTRLIYRRKRSVSIFLPNFFSFSSSWRFCRQHMMNVDTFHVLAIDVVVIASTKRNLSFTLLRYREFRKKKKKNKTKLNQFEKVENIIFIHFLSSFHFFSTFVFHVAFGEHTKLNHLICIISMEKKSCQIEFPFDSVFKVANELSLRAFVSMPKLIKRNFNIFLMLFSIFHRLHSSIVSTDLICDFCVVCTFRQFSFPSHHCDYACTPQQNEQKKIEWRNFVSRSHSDFH